MFLLVRTEFPKPLLWELEFVQDLDMYSNFGTLFSF